MTEGAHGHQGAVRAAYAGFQTVGGVQLWKKESYLIQTGSPDSYAPTLD